MRWLLVVTLTFSPFLTVMAQYEQPAGQEQHGSYGSSSKIFGEANEHKAQEHLDGGLLPPSNYVRPENSPGIPDPLAGYGRAPPSPAENPGTEPLPPSASTPSEPSEQWTSPSSPGTETAGEQAASTTGTYETKETVDSSSEGSVPAQPAVEQPAQPAAPEESITGPEAAATTEASKEGYSEAKSNAVAEGSTEAPAAEMVAESSSSAAPAEVPKGPEYVTEAPSGGEQSITEAGSEQPAVTEAPSASSKALAQPEEQTTTGSPSETSAAPVAENPAPSAEAGYEHGPATAEAVSEKPAATPEETTAAAAADETTSLAAGTPAVAVQPAEGTPEMPKVESYNAGSVAPAESSTPVIGTATVTQPGEQAPKEESYKTPEGGSETSTGFSETAVTSEEAPAASSEAPAATEAPAGEAYSSFAPVPEASETATSASSEEAKAPEQSYEHPAPAGGSSSSGNSAPDAAALVTDAPASDTYTSAAPAQEATEAAVASASTALAEEAKSPEQSYEQAGPVGVPSSGGSSPSNEAMSAPVPPATEAAPPASEGSAPAGQPEPPAASGQYPEATTLPATPTEVSASSSVDQGIAVTTPRANEIEGSGSSEEHTSEGSGSVPNTPPQLPTSETGNALPSPSSVDGNTDENASGSSTEGPGYVSPVPSNSTKSKEEVIEVGKTAEGSGYTSAEKVSGDTPPGEGSKGPQESNSEPASDATGAKAEAGTYEEPTKQVEDRSTDSLLEEANDSEWLKKVKGKRIITGRRSRTPKIDGEVTPVARRTTELPAGRTTVLEDIILANMGEVAKERTGPFSSEVVITAVVDPMFFADEKRNEIDTIVSFKEEKNKPLKRNEAIIDFKEEVPLDSSSPGTGELVLSLQKNRTETTDSQGENIIVEGRKLNVGPKEVIKITKSIAPATNSTGTRKTTKVRKVHKLRRLRVVHRSRSTIPPVAWDLPTNSGDKDLGGGEKVVQPKEDKYVTAPGEKTALPGVTPAPEASKTVSPADWNTVSPTQPDNTLTETTTKITETASNTLLFSTDQTNSNNKELEPSGYEMGNEPVHISTPDFPAIKPEEAVGYDGISKDDIKKDLPQQQQDLGRRTGGEAKLIRKPKFRSSTERTVRWTPYRFDCATEEDDKGLLCNEWAQAGLCELHRPTMFLFCRKTCLCTGPTTRKKRSFGF